MAYSFVTFSEINIQANIIGSYQGLRIGKLKVHCMYNIAINFFQHCLSLSQGCQARVQTWAPSVVGRCEKFGGKIEGAALHFCVSQLQHPSQ